MRTVQAVTQPLQEMPEPLEKINPATWQAWFEKIEHITILTGLQPTLSVCDSCHPGWAVSGQSCLDKLLWAWSPPSNAAVTNLCACAHTDPCAWAYMSTCTYAHTCLETVVPGTMETYTKQAQRGDEQGVM